MTETFAVLFSHASTTVYQDYVTTDRFATSRDAATYGTAVARIQGVEFEVMELINRQWLSRRRETPTEVIRRRWTW